MAEEVDTQTQVMEGRKEGRKERKEGRKQRMEGGKKVD